MNREVHYELTREWALAEGFSEGEAETIAASNWDTDDVLTGKDPRNRRYHFSLFGADFESMRFMRIALASGDLIALGRALHCAQDSVGHGIVGYYNHYFGIDRLEHRSQRLHTRLEKVSRRMLRRYRARQPLAGDVRAKTGA